MDHTVTVNVQGAPYAIHIGTGLLQQAGVLWPFLAGAGPVKRVLLVTNDTVGPLYAERVRLACGEVEWDSYTVPDGEAYKTLETWRQILDRLIANRHPGDTTLLALGGGVVGDMTGFAAACYQRGVAFLQIPTTLLAQVDASIGGKTAVNHPAGKNLIGAFHQPRGVFVDVDVLHTLPEREFRAGLAEILKAALIADVTFWQWLRDSCDALLGRETAALSHAILRACEIKRDIVAQDPLEQTHLRTLLNLGHTFGHALEHALGYGVWLHGEAVAVGLCLAAKLSVRCTALPPAVRDEIIACVSRFGLPTDLPKETKYDTVLEAMQWDKKVRSGRLRFVLLRAVGQACVIEHVTEDELRTL
ncbi:MAG: 3-dehydroquinate synthase [Gammaproteobacteria bacterium RIFCSPHIGHO2_12_FULL_45_9]|nr:MAG: 3-dehydroquinate synthase [Gammaproteobacteria bacterium RIFCSPHIGHO2_12_FULL_45_9]